MSVHRPSDGLPAFRRPHPPPSLYVLSYPRALTFMTEEDYLPPEHGDNRGRISFDGEERSKRVRGGNMLSLSLYASTSPSAPSVSAIGPHVEELGDIFTWVQSVLDCWYIRHRGLQPDTRNAPVGYQLFSHAE